MKPTLKLLSTQPPLSRWLPGVLLLASPSLVHASMFQGEALDKVADIMTWVVLVIAPVIAIGVFLLIHILPEKIAEKKKHPQTRAIQCLCLLSLFFGGMLWPLAWLWAYTKPVLHQLAYGTDKEAHGHEAETPPVLENSEVVQAELAELQALRKRVAELESRVAGASGADGGKV